MGVTKDFSRAVLFESSSIYLSSHPILPTLPLTYGVFHSIPKEEEKERREGKKDRNVGEGAFVVLELTVIALA